MLSLQRREPTLAWCAQRLAPSSGRSRELRVLTLLDELTRREVLTGDSAGHRFASAVLRDAVVAQMTELERTHAHAQLGAVFESFADAALRRRGRSRSATSGPRATPCSSPAQTLQLHAANGGPHGDTLVDAVGSDVTVRHGVSN